MLAKPFNRSVAESLLSPTGTNNYWVIDDRGIWPKAEWNPASGTGSRINFEFDSWRPAVMFANDSLPQAPGDLPALPFPFDAKDLASFMLYGFGALVADHYGDWENGPNPERIDDLYPLDFSRRAVKEAFEAYREAQRIVDPYPLELDAKAERARKAWSDVDSETDKETKAERGLEMEATAAEAKAAQGKWLEDMVRELLQSTLTKANLTPAPTVVASDGQSNRRNRKPSWAVVAMPYMKELYAKGNYRSSSVFYKALKNKVDDDNSPFKLVKGELFCPQAGTTVGESTLGNVWHKVRE